MIVVKKNLNSFLRLLMHFSTAYFISAMKTPVNHLRKQF